MKQRPITEQIARQCRATMTMLPYASVAGLGSLDLEVVVTVFGQTMRILNELPDLKRFAVEEEFRKAELQREYWRCKQRDSRARRRSKEAPPEKEESI